MSHLGRLRSSRWHRAGPYLRVSIVTALLVAGCSSGDAGGDPARETVQPAPVVNQTVFLQATDQSSDWRQAGTATVQVKVHTLDGGSVTAAPGPEDGSAAIQFPAYVATGAYPRAVVEITNAGSADELNPGTQPFSWGADFKLDTLNEGRSMDNGNNLIERGLFSEVAFYKAELDHGKPACSVRGTAGLVVVRAQQVVEPNVWYRMQCTRESGRLSVRAVQLGGAEETISAQKAGDSGAVVMENAAVPLGVGGKVAQDGAIIRTATDQFNGAVARPFLDIGNLG